jgi:hypothetical protein
MSSADKIKLDGLTQGIAAGDFTGSNQLLANNGYQKLPGGLIVQWGSTASNVGGINTSHSVTFPIAFPTAAYCVVIGTLTSSTDSNGAQRMAQLVSRTTTGFTWFSDRFEGESNPIGVHYIAIGS